MAKILIVEDNSILCKTLQYNLLADGYEVLTANSKKEAQVMLKKLTFDLVILDVNLPDGDGFEFYKEIQCGFPTIFLTARDMESDIIKGYELGAEDYITKPFSMPVFLKKLLF